MQIAGNYSLLEFPKKDEKLNEREITVRDTLRVIAKIAAIRGLPRFIAQISLREEVKYKDLYSRSRIFILWVAVKESDKFWGTIRSLRISQFKIGEFPKSTIRAPFFPWDKKELEVWQQKTYYVIPNYSKYNLIELNLETKGQQNSFLIELGNHSPKLFFKILSELNPSEDEANILLRKIPVVANFFSSYKKLKCAIDPHADLTIDEVFINSKPIRKINNAEIWHAIHIVKDGNWVLKDITEHPKQKFVAGHSHFASKNTEEVILATPRGEVLKITKGFLLTKRCDENWYHFLIDLLPQVVFLKNLPSKTKIIARDDLPDTAKAILKYLQLDIIFVGMTSKIIVKSLYYIPHRSSVFDSPVRVGHHSRVLFPEQALLKLRDRLKNYETKDVQLVGHPAIFILRTGMFRNCKNMPEVEQVLTKEGFRRIKINKLYLKNQFTLFRDADSIVLSGGAIVANMIFMKELTSMVVLGSWRSASLGIWSRLGLVFGVRVDEVKGVPTSFSLNYSRRLHSDYFIPGVLLRHYLKR